MPGRVDGLYPWPLDGSLSPATTALVVIDMQVDFCGPGGWLDCIGHDLSDLRRPIAPLQRLLAALRAHGFPIYHTREGHRPDLADLHPNKRWRTGHDGAAIGDSGPLGRHLVRGEPGWDIIEELRPLAGETVIDKPGKGAFHATDFDQILKTRGIRNLIVSGVTTDCCVQSTLRDADDRGYDCLLLEDCCGAALHANHLAQIAMLKQAGGLHGSVATSADLLAVLR